MRSASSAQPALTLIPLLALFLEGVMGEGLTKSFRKETEVGNATNLSEKRRKN